MKLGTFCSKDKDMASITGRVAQSIPRSRIPTGVLLVLYVIASLSLGAMGYHGGVAGSIRSPVTVAVAIAFSLVIMVIANLDRPTGGFINVSQDAMIDLQNSLTESKP